MRIFSLCLTLLLAITVWGQPNFNSAKLDSLFSILNEKQKAMGSFAYTQQGQMVYQNNSGFICKDKNGTTPATPASLYRIGSITKMFTAVMIFQLIDEQKLKLHTSLKEFFPQIPNAGNITIDYMLNHQSGIFNFTNKQEYLSYLETAQTKEQMLDRMVLLAPAFKPGEKSEYSNSNYVLLGYIIEILDKQPYAQCLKTRITEPLQLKNTGVFVPANCAKHIAQSYKMGQESWVPTTQTHVSIPGGAGAILSTPADLCLFITQLFETRVLSGYSFGKMQEITRGYGRGLFKSAYATDSAFGHNGGIDGFASSLAYFPETKTALAYTSNAMVYGLGELMQGSHAIINNQEFKVPTFELVEVPLEILEQYTGLYKSDKIPIDITVKIVDGYLIAQGTNQPELPMAAESNEHFTYSPAGLSLTFTKNEDTNLFEMTLKQSGATILFTKTP